MKLPQRKKNSGYSLIELVVVVGLMAMLGGVLLFQFTPLKKLLSRGPCITYQRDVHHACKAYEICKVFSWRCVQHRERDRLR